MTGGRERGREGEKEEEGENRRGERREGWEEGEEEGGEEGGEEGEEGSGGRRGGGRGRKGRRERQGAGDKHMHNSIHHYASQCRFKFSCTKLYNSNVTSYLGCIPAPSLWGSFLLHSIRNVVHFVKQHLPHSTICFNAASVTEIFNVCSSEQQKFCD